MLILLLRIIILAVVTLWSFLTRLIFSSIAYLVVALIQGLKLPGEAVHGGFQQISEAIRACFEMLASLIMESVSFVVNTLFDIVKESVTGSVDAFGSVVGTLAEAMKTSFDEALNYFQELLGEIAGMGTSMIEELWNNFKDAIGYVMENSA